MEQEYRLTGWAMERMGGDGDTATWEQIVAVWPDAEQWGCRVTAPGIDQPERGHGGYAPETDADGDVILARETAS